MSVVYQHEGQWVIIFVNSQKEWRLREETAHHIVKGKTVFGRQKMVGSVNRSSPNFDHAFALTRAGMPNFYHTHLINTTSVEKKAVRYALARPAGTEEIAIQIKNAALKDDKALQIIEAFLALDDWSDDAIAPRGLVRKAQAFVLSMKGGAA